MHLRCPAGFRPLMLHHQFWGAEKLCGMQVRVRFDVEEALEELTRLELVEKLGSNESNGSGNRNGNGNANGNGNGDGGPLYKCVKPEDAIQRLEDTWQAILQSRLQSVEGASASGMREQSPAV